MQFEQVSFGDEIGEWILWNWFSTDMCTNSDKKKPRYIFKGFGFTLVLVCFDGLQPILLYSGIIYTSLLIMPISSCLYVFFMNDHTKHIITVIIDYVPKLIIFPYMNCKSSTLFTKHWYFHNSTEMNDIHNPVVGIFTRIMNPFVYFPLLRYCTVCHRT